MATSITKSISIVYNCLQPTAISKSFLYRDLSENFSLGKSIVWKNSNKAEKLKTVPVKYSEYSNYFLKSSLNLWESTVRPNLNIGNSIKTYINANINPFNDAEIINYSNNIDYLEWRIGDNVWNKVDTTEDDFNTSIKDVEYDFKEVGSVPCQVRAILDGGEIVYSEEKYVTVTTENDTEVQLFLTSPTDEYKNLPEYSLGGINSNVPVNISSKIINEDGISETDNEIEIENSEYFNNSGYVAIGNEIISYNSKTNKYPFKLIGCYRGRFNTIPDSHKLNTKVRLILIGSLFDNIKNSELILKNKTDYRCVCVKNTKKIESGDISLFFPFAFNENNPEEKLQFAIERSVAGTTVFSQEVVNDAAEPFVSTNNSVEIINLIPSVFDTESKLGIEFGEEFGYTTKRNVDNDETFVFLNKNSIEGDVIYRFFENKFVTIDKIKYNTSSVDESSIYVSYRYGNSIEEIDASQWTDFEAENHYASTDIIREIKSYTKYFDVKIKLERKELDKSSPSFGDFTIIYWDRGYSRFIQTTDEKTRRSLTINTDFFGNNYNEFHIGYPEETTSNLKPLTDEDNYIIQSTYASDIGKDSIYVKFYQGLSCSFVPYENSSLREIVIYERRIDWDNSTASSIDLTLNLLLYDDDIENGGKIIGTSSQTMTLTEKITHSSHRVFELDKVVELKAGKTYWFYVYPECVPEVKGLWRFRGTTDLAYGNPDNNKIKIFDKSNGMIKISERDDFAIGFVAIGKLSDSLLGYHNSNSTIYYTLSPSGLNGNEWEFDGINLSFNTPYNNRYKIGPYIHAMWKSSSNRGWHRFRPWKISSIYGTQNLAPSSKYKTISSEDYIIIRIEIDKIMDSDSLDAIRGFGEFGLGAQPAINSLEVSWHQNINENFTSNAVSKWIDCPKNYVDSIKLSDIYDSWSNNLLPEEQFFIWLKRDYSEVNSSINNSGFSLTINHGVETLYEIKEYDHDNWQSITSEEVPEVPANIDVPSSSNNGTYIVSWDNGQNASLYELQESSDEFVTIAITASTSCVVRGKEDGIYRYAVRSINSVGASEYIYSSLIIVTLVN